MSFEDAWRKIEAAQAAMWQAVNSAFHSDALHMLSTSKTTIFLSDEGLVEIRGELKELRINGKLVRFKKEKAT